MNGMVNRLLIPLVIAFILSSCASTPPPAGELTYKSRAVTRTEGGLRVSAAVLSAEESTATYGVALAKKSIQPVWVEVSNDETLSYFLMSPGVDPNFFPASEAAEAFANANSPGGKEELDQRFRRLAFRNPILAGQTNSGFVLTHLNEGAKLVQLDLVASAQARTFSILIVVPGFYADYHVSEVFRRDIYPPEKIVDHTDDDAFRSALEALPCCATNQDGSKQWRSAQSGPRGRPRRRLPRTGAPRLEPDRAKVVWRDHEDGHLRAFWRSLCQCASKRPLFVWPSAGPRVAESA